MRYLLAAWLVAVWGSGPVWAADPLPDILLLSVDTLRADRLGAYGYERNTSPNIDELLAAGGRFDSARTVEPLTAPALASMLTSLAPHDHGSTRNGLHVREKLPSLPRLLRHQGYRTAAFVGSWPLRPKLWGMAEHFDLFEAVLTEARWLGIRTREAKADDINHRALDWLRKHRAEEGRRPFFLWLHYVEPHAPYVLQSSFVAQIGTPSEGRTDSKSNRYDSEIAYVDHRIGQLLRDLDAISENSSILTVFVSDHGESLGEHDYWGHGRNLLEPNLRIPMGITWKGRIAPGVVGAPSSIGDLARTIVGLIGIEAPSFLQGFDWSGVLVRQEPEPVERKTFHQAHRGAVTKREDQTHVREKGLLEVASFDGRRKEIFRPRNDSRWVFDLAIDPGEQKSLEPVESVASEQVAGWLAVVQQGLVASDALPPPSLSDDDVEALRALGYLE